MELDHMKLRRIMATKGFNITTLAEAAGLSPTAIGNWLNHGTRPRLDTIGKLAKALEIDVGELLKD